MLWFIINWYFVYGIVLLGVGFQNDKHTTAVFIDLQQVAGSRCYVGPLQNRISTIPMIYNLHDTNIMSTIGSPLAIRNCAPRSIRNALVFYCYFSTAFLQKVVVENENEINNVFLWSFKTEFLKKWTLRSLKKNANCRQCSSPYRKEYL